MNTLSYSEALREAMREEMKRDPAVFLLGEDIGLYGGAFGVTRGLLDEFGSDRVVNTPISEPGFMGVAVGAAITGGRPVVEIMFMDFCTLTMDQLVNHAAKMRYVFGSQVTCPLVVRMAGGGGKGYGPTHSQSLEAWFLHVPGLKVVAPSTPADAKGLLKTAIRDDNPVIFVEHKLLYGKKGPVPGPDAPAIPFGQARLACAGTDVTIVAWSLMAFEAEAAAQELAARGVSAEVLDLRSLNPLDMASIVESVKKTHRLLIVEEGTRTGGVAAEIGFQVFEQIYDYLDSPITRLTTPDIPISASPVLEKAAIPDRACIVEAAIKLVKQPG
jgi:pyruvate/2-oxoglutarate/acetoin dehydrogenase E1 component